MIWKYRAQLDRVVDGDTVDIRVDLGFRTYKEVRVRLKKVDTAEIYGVPKESDEYQRGEEQRQFVAEFLSGHDGGWPIHFVSHEETGKYGRWLGDLTVDGDSVSEALIEKWPEVEK